MRFVCRSRLTNTKISIDKRRLSHIFVFVAHSPHRNKMNCRNRKNPSNYRFMHLLLIFWIPVNQKKLFVTRGFWVRRYVLQEVQWTSVLQRPKRSVDHWCFQCPYRYVLNERKRPQDQRYSAELRKQIKSPPEHLFQTPTWNCFDIIIFYTKSIIT